MPSLAMALAYAAHGWAVFPLSPRSKVPAIAGGRGCLDATHDADRIRQWWAQYPQAGIGIATGAISGLLVIDVDPRNGGDETMAALEKEHGRLPETPRALTGGGGVHYLFSFPEGVRPTGRLGDGLDVKSSGGYVVAPPSIHPVTGRKYRWDLGALPSETAIAPLPAWLLGLIQSPPSRAPRPPIDGASAADSVVGEAFRLASMLGEPLRDGLYAVRCPWFEEHTDGRGDGTDSSTAIFPPTTKRRIGGFLCRHGHCAGRSTTAALDALPADAVQKARVKFGWHVVEVKKDDPAWAGDDEVPHDPETGEFDPRPVVHIHATRVSESVDALDEGIAKADDRVFQRAHSLVHVLPAVRVKGVSDDTPILRNLTGPALLDRVTRHLRCQTWKAAEKGAIRFAASTGQAEPTGQWVDCVPPVRLLLDPFLHRGHWDHVRPIRSIAECPFLRPDGTLCDTPGYDAMSATLYIPNDTYPALPPAPTQEDARRALAELTHVFCDFPYLTPDHAMVPIAALLTVVGRGAILGPVPAFVYDASVRGSGKTMQGDVVHAIATGRRASHGTLPASEEEREKTLSGYALLGARIVFIDNVKGLFGGPKVEATLTSTDVSFRVLGKPDVIELPWIATMLVSGNNLQITDDMRRRVLVARLETPLEDPTTRTDFAHPELVAWVLSERPRLLAAALTVLVAYIAHGCPDAGCGSLGEPYGSWSKIVPGAIRFAGGANVLACRAPEESGGLDEIGALSTLLKGWDALGETTVTGICRKLAPQSAPDSLDELRDALEVLAPPRTAGGRVDPRSLSHAFRRHRGRWVDGRRLVSGSRLAHGGVATWAIESRVDR